jgi:hypothetical protein
MDSMSLTLVLWLVCGIAAGMLNESKGHSKTNGFVIGLIFGIFGVLYVVFRGPQSTVPEDPYAFRPDSRFK